MRLDSGTFSCDTKFFFQLTYAVTYLRKVLPKLFVAFFEAAALRTRGVAFPECTLPDRTSPAGYPAASLILTTVAVEIFELEVRLLSKAPFLSHFHSCVAVFVNRGLI